MVESQIQAMNRTEIYNGLLNLEFMKLMKSIYATTLS